MTAEVVIRRHSSAGTFSEATGRTTYPDPTEVWTGWARLQRTGQQQGVKQVGDRQVAIHGIVVSLPADVPPVNVADEVQVLSYRDPDSGDPDLVGRPLWVHNVRAGSLLWQRDLVAFDTPPTSR